MEIDTQPRKPTGLTTMPSVVHGFRKCHVLNLAGLLGDSTWSAAAVNKAIIEDPKLSRANTVCFANPQSTENDHKEQNDGRSTVSKPGRTLQEREDEEGWQEAHDRRLQAAHRVSPARTRAAESKETNSPIPCTTLPLEETELPFFLFDSALRQLRVCLLAALLINQADEQRLGYAEAQRVQLVPKAIAVLQLFLMLLCPLRTRLLLLAQILLRKEEDPILPLVLGISNVPRARGVPSVSSATTTCPPTPQGCQSCAKRGENTRAMTGVLVVDHQLHSMRDPMGLSATAAYFGVSCFRCFWRCR
mmetsp:Transcript_3574/g.6343  ORF Transcript_3574/g.6343 Transcript_3574/m.6343 type:complete len:304 (+) Transcript_3574:49-960(+)